MDVIPPAGAVGKIERRIEVGEVDPRNFVHVPDLRRAAVSVVPKKVDVAVLIEVPRPDRAPPAAIGDVQGRLQIGEARPLHAIHVPDLRYPADAVVDDDVDLPVMVEISDANDLPAGAIRERIWSTPRRAGSMAKALLRT
jgi:hypothetical protein